MTITFPCSQCGKQYRAQAEHAGKQMKCQHCGAIVKIPTPKRTGGSVPAGGSLPADPAARAARRRSAIPAARNTGAGDAPSAAASEVVRCPHCHADCRIRLEWRGRTLQCPRCKTRFVVPAVGTVPPPRAQAESDVFTESGYDLEESVSTDASSHGAWNTDVASAPVVRRPGRRLKPKTASPWGRFSEWVQGSGLWILNGAFGGLAVLLILVNASNQAGPLGPIAALIGLLCAGVILGAVLAVMALVLRGVCPMLDVDPPGYGRGMGILLLVWEFSIIVSTIVELILGPVDPQRFDLSNVVFRLVLGVLINLTASVVIFSAALGTSFGKSVLIWLFEVAVIIALSLVVGCILFIVFMVLGVSLAGRAPQ